MPAIQLEWMPHGIAVGEQFFENSSQYKLSQSRNDMVTRNRVAIGTVMLYSLNDSRIPDNRGKQFIQPVL